MCLVTVACEQWPRRCPSSMLEEERMTRLCDTGGEGGLLDLASRIGVKKVILIGFFYSASFRGYCTYWRNKERFRNSNHHYPHLATSVDSIPAPTRVEATRSRSFPFPDDQWSSFSSRLFRGSVKFVVAAAASRWARRAT